MMTTCLIGVWVDGGDGDDPAKPGTAAKVVRMVLAARAASLVFQISEGLIDIKFPRELLRSPFVVLNGASRHWSLIDANRMVRTG